jgi:hypothetical protein
VEANLHLGFRPDERDYGVSAQILADLGAKRVRILTNNPAKERGLRAYGIEVVERVPILVGLNPMNARYLATKQEKLGHLLDLEELDFGLEKPFWAAGRRRKDGHERVSATMDASGKRFALIAARWNRPSCRVWCEGRWKVDPTGSRRGRRVDLLVPGSFEIPQLPGSRPRRRYAMIRLGAFGSTH